MKAFWGFLEVFFSNFFFRECQPRVLHEICTKLVNLILLMAVFASCPIYPEVTINSLHWEDKYM